MIVQPLKNKVALKEVKRESKSDSGLVLMGGTGETPEFAVIAIGPNVDCVKVGDTVMIEINKAKVVGNSMLIIEDVFITAVVDE